jgi:uncharacterized protein YjbI with pentapeptide repeats
MHRHGRSVHTAAVGGLLGAAHGALLTGALLTGALLTGALLSGVRP